MTVEDTQEEKTFKAMFRRFLRDTISCAGCSRIIQSQSRLRSFIWTCILLCSLTYLTYQNWKSVREYLKYPKVIKMEVLSSRELKFPGVTICDMNPFPKSELKNMHSRLLIEEVRNFISSCHRKRLLSSQLRKSITKKMCTEHVLCTWLYIERQCECTPDLCSSSKCRLETDKERVYCFCDESLCGDAFATKLEYEGYICRWQKVGLEWKCLCNNTGEQYNSGEIGLTHSTTESIHYGKNITEYEELEEYIQNFHEVLKNPKMFLQTIRRSKTYDLSDLGMILLPSKEDIKNYGIRFKDFILSCSFNGESCLDSREFFEFLDPVYGRCFSFNYRRDETTKIKHTSQYGCQSGLQLLLKGDRTEYVDLYSRQIGIRVAIHDPDDIPKMTDSGINIKYNDLTTLEMKYLHVQKLGEPWGKCHNDFSQLGFGENVGKYTLEKCQHICKDRNVFKRCGCYLVGYERWNVSSGAADCDLLKKETRDCISDVKQQIAKEEIECKCYPQCKMDVYEVSRSSTELNYNFYTQVKAIKTFDEATGTCNAYVDRIRTGLHVYFSNLYYQKIEEIPTYSWETLLSNIGGNMGLLVGMSAITVVECVEFLWDVLRFVLGFPQRTHTTQVKACN
ncbi:degenerin unc-8-like [Tachypleus tridentatus]|uniref:degenerin unc-8-like n=1 Tax=Tachypleus tridentatus TaxID=6853 RepID=UPI003FD0617E